MSVIVILMLAAAAVSGFFGFHLGREIPGTTIFGLKASFVIWSIFMGLAVGSIIGLGNWMFGLALAAGVGLGALTGLGGAMLGALSGYLWARLS